MKGLVKTAKRTLSMLELEDPIPNGQDVIVRVTHCGICGSDVHMWSSDDKLGFVFGHEFSGIVEDTGKSDLKAGDRVAVLPSLGDGKGVVGVTGIQGAYTTHFKQSPNFTRKLPDSLSNEAAALIEPLAITLNGVRRTHIDLNDRLLITGTGIIGLGCAEWARLQGADTIVMTEINIDKIAMVKATGICDHILNAGDPDIKEKLLEITKGKGFDKVIECTGSQSGMQLCIDVTRREGQITYLGIDYHPIALLTRPIVANQLSVVGAYGGMFSLCDEIIGHLERGRIHPEKFITSRITLEEVQAKLEELANGQTTEIKSIIVN